MEWVPLAVGLALAGVVAPVGSREAIAREVERTPEDAAQAWARIPVPARVTGGDRIRLALAARPADVEEFEILLSLDDGRSFPVRVTRELEAGEREIEWRVPKLASGAARLRVRFGRDGREWNGPLSDAFTIITRGEAAEWRVWHECGWWEGLDAATASARPGFADERGPWLAAAGEAPLLEAPRPDTDLPTPPRQRLPAVAVTCVAVSAGSAARAPLTRTLPMRN